MKIEVSVGEAVDKATILKIKSERIKDPLKLRHVRMEYELLRKSLEEEGISCDSDDFKELKAVNERLWDIEDRIRRKDRDREFGDEFIELAKAVYRENDKRFEIKTRINARAGSEIVEEKEYVDYEGPESAT
jgi:hypothetical protein